MRKFWTHDEQERLRQLYPDTPTGQLCEVFGATEKQVYSKAKRMGLRKSDQYMQAHVWSHLAEGWQAGVKTRFQPGQVSWNKGTKGVCGQHPNSRKTQFKRGEMVGAAQHNYKPIDSLRITKDGYLEQKVTDDHPVPARRWVAVHRLVWEREHGPVEPGHIVTFKPGKKTVVFEQITVDCLEMISRQENARRNYIERYPRELRQLIQLRGVLNRRINHVEKHQPSQD